LDLISLNSIPHRLLQHMIIVSKFSTAFSGIYNLNHFLSNTQS
jgi:hypothetical protein